MTLEMFRSLLLYCTIINFGILLVWFVGFVAGRRWMFRLHGRWFRLQDDQFDTIHYAGMAAFKIGIILFNLVPWIALTILK